MNHLIKLQDSGLWHPFSNEYPARIDYSIDLKKLLANGQFFIGAQMAVSL